MAAIKRHALAREEGRQRATTLAEIAAQSLGVFCWCNRCAHNAFVDSGPLAAALGGDVPVPEVGTRLRCSNCGAKDIASRPAWPGLGQVTRHG